ncbi:MAG TPA: flavodoxin family protein [Ferrovibrio sp.]|jgi:NAD(P)H dehydrogenase (quinone)|uniref:flavodoxin family protein n=1 Tax=Ferrovibrio sp. TaxID=1917215 RepID=UPI002B4ACD2E|nr:flavodoxin family protein [Ferrovibrio sp.]HLT77758.1 flavodoxin family protein [Ferrovibrio sp.]
MSQPTPTIAVVYHSGYGHTRKQAEAVADGARAVTGARVTLVPVEEADTRLEEIGAADAIILGSPTYMGSVSGPFKTWMDSTSKVWGQWNGKLAAGFTNSASQSGDKLNTLVQLSIFAAQHGMHWINLGLMPGNNNSKGSVNDLNRLGSFLGAMAQSNADQGPEHGPIASDLETARILGRRVAETAAQFVKGREREPVAA